MISREKILLTLHGALDAHKVPEATIKKLGRDLHVAASGQTTDMVKAYVGFWKDRLSAPGADPVQVASVFLHKTNGMSYADQKVVQWIAATCYSHGLKEGRSAT